MRILHVTDHYPPVLGGIESARGRARRAAGRRRPRRHRADLTPRDADGRHSDDRGRSGAPGPLAPRTWPRATSRRTTWCTRTSRWSRRSPRRWSRRPPAEACRRWSPCTRCGAASVRCRRGRRRSPGSAPRRCCGPRSAGWPAAQLADLAARSAPRSACCRTPWTCGRAPRTPERAAGDPVRLVSTMRIARRKRPLPLLAMLRRPRADGRRAGASSPSSATGRRRPGSSG